ncbi:hypothetical protein FVE85_4354 [Porphyridium purpureum]|uniref:Uncharacterized protein n=1 Tax=Porphyridium purpureum TaxID=35688 RepID=A0A5J4YJ79_PORPP|nr:hypothetical protein FVE85_4354 [Porphyridium purpureum]|eukprot:POR7031..scf270_19
MVVVSYEHIDVSYFLQKTCSSWTRGKALRRKNDASAWVQKAGRCKRGDIVKTRCRDNGAIERRAGTDVISPCCFTCLPCYEVVLSRTQQGSLKTAGSLRPTVRDLLRTDDSGKADLERTSVYPACHSVDVDLVEMKE